MTWKLRVVDRTVTPPMDTITEHVSEDDALKDACPKLWLAHYEVSIERPDGEHIGHDDIRALCRDRYPGL